MANKNMVKIDAKKLYDAIEERGLTFSHVCKEIGVNNSYFANAKVRGTLANLAVVILESRFGIPKDSYVISDEETAVTVVEKVSTVDDFFSEENQRKLYRLMYSAMYAAVKQALSE